MTNTQAALVQPSSLDLYALYCPQLIILRATESFLHKKYLNPRNAPSDATEKACTRKACRSTPIIPVGERERERIVKRLNEENRVTL